MRRNVLACVLLSLAAAPVLAQTETAMPASTSAAAATANTPIRDEAPVVVTGALPGPGMWKVFKGDHVMYVLGTVSPLPKRMEWISRDVEKALAESDEVLLGSGVDIDADVGFFGKLTLLPSLIGIRKSPDGAELKDLVSPASYARWLTLKQRYIGRDSDVEKWRPVFAATRLYEEAIEDEGLVPSGIVAPVIDKAIKQHKIKRTEPRVKIKIKQPKAALKEFRGERLSDLDCFDKMLQNLESDLVRMTERANAWAVGDIEVLRNLPLGDQGQSCWRAVTQASVARKNGLADIENETRKVWLSAAESALDNNAVSFAVLPMSQLLKSDGYLAALQTKGYAVEAP
ncbi:MAG TPA: TraB/GumN family protein [Lysobacter sp.]|nr:TraB/GumN family protein [Lysobacter sp.]